MSEDLTVTYSGLSADEKRVIINDKRAVRLRHGCAITERRALDRTASELQDTCHKQAQRIAVLEQAVRQALDWAGSHGEAVFMGGGMPAIDEMNAWTKALREAMTA